MGEDVNKGARVAAVANGGQSLLTRGTRELVHVEVTDLGEHRAKVNKPVWIFQLGSKQFPPQGRRAPINQAIRPFKYALNDHLSPGVVIVSGLGPPRGGSGLEGCCPILLPP